MDRRRFLAGLGAGVLPVAGCSRIAGLSRETTRRDGFERRSVSIVTTDDVPDGSPLELSVETTSNEAISERSVQFRFTLTNRDDTTRESSVGQLPVANLLGGRSDPPSYLLLQPEYWTKDDRQDDCWENDQPDQDPYRVAPEAKRLQLAPGESHAGEAALWGSVEDDSCWPPGEFEFRGTAGFADSPGLTWGFRFEVIRA